MMHYVGSSGFAYKNWRGVFYPSELKEPAFLDYYARRLPSVELNNSFYRMPSQSMIERWVGEVPPTFRFAVKAPQRITHRLRLRDAEEAVVEFATQLNAFGSSLAAVLFQLPPNLRSDVERLAKFLDACPKTLPCAFEFRHASWLDDNVFAVLRDHGAALCSADGEAVDTPLLATSELGYVRLRAETYTEEALVAYAERIKAQPWKTVCVYFKHEPTAPAYASTLLKALQG